MKTCVKALVVGLAGLVSGGEFHCQADFEAGVTNQPAHTNLILKGDTPVSQPIPVPPSPTVQRSNDGPNLILQGPPPPKGSAPVIPPWMQDKGTTSPPPQETTPIERRTEEGAVYAQPSPAQPAPPPDAGGQGISGALEGSQQVGVPPPPVGTPMGPQPGVTNRPQLWKNGDHYYDHSNHYDRDGSGQNDGGRKWRNTLTNS